MATSRARRTIALASQRLRRRAASTPSGPHGWRERTGGGGLWLAHHCLVRAILATRAAVLGAIVALVSPVAHAGKWKLGQAMKSARGTATKMRDYLWMGDLPPSMVSRPLHILGLAQRRVDASLPRRGSTEIDDGYGGLTIERVKRNGKGKLRLWIEDTSKRGQMELSDPKGRVTETQSVSITPTGFARVLRERGLHPKGQKRS